MLLRGLVALAALLILAGCGSGGSPPTPTSAAAQPSDAAVKFTQCMREHGVQLPDPPPGAQTVQLPGGTKNDPNAQAAIQACQHFLAQGASKDLNDPAAQDKAVALARCLRQHGIDVADPQPGQPLQLNVNSRDPATMQAIQDCRAATGATNG